MAIYQKKNIFAGYLKRRKAQSIKEQGIFLNRLGEMLENGFTLAEGINFLGKIEGKNKEQYKIMLNELQCGDPFYEVLNGQHFDPKACAQIYFADQHGFLGQTLRESGAYLLKRAEDRNLFLKIIQYPIVLIITVSLVMVLLNKVLLPRFEEMYQSVAYVPDSNTRILLHIMQNIPTYLTVCIISILLLIMLTTVFLQNKTALERAQFFGKIPYIGSFYKLYTTQFLSREWGFLLKRGFSINEILLMMSTQSFRPLFHEAADKQREHLKLGHSFSESLMEFQFLKTELKMIVQHGEKSGLLAEELLYYSRFCLQQMEEKWQKIFKVIQPLMLILIGLLVVAVYMSILLPMFQMLGAF